MIADDLVITVSYSAFVSVVYLMSIARFCLVFSKIADRTDIRQMFLVETVSSTSYP